MTQIKQKSKRPVGRPRAANRAYKSLGGVRVTAEQLEAYKLSADQDGKKLAEWVRDVLDKAAI